MAASSVEKKNGIKIVRDRVYLYYLCIPVTYVISMTAFVAYIIVKNTHSQIAAAENLALFTPLDFYLTLIMGFLISAFAIYQMFPVFSFFKESIGEDDLEVSNFGMFINSIIRSQIALLIFLFLLSLYTIPHVSHRINGFLLVSFFMNVVLDILSVQFATSKNESGQKRFNTCTKSSAFYTLILVFLLPNYWVKLTYALYRALTYFMMKKVNSNTSLLGKLFKKRIVFALTLLVLNANILMFFSVIDPVLFITNYVCAPFSIFKACIDKLLLINLPKIVASSL